MEKIILNKKRTFQGYTRYPDKAFKDIKTSEYLLCSIDARKCPVRQRGKAKENEWCRDMVYRIEKAGNCRKIKIVIEEKTHINIQVL